MSRFARLRPYFSRGRWQSGQSIVVLAFGFIALLGFVGIVTDVSLLFVRYSSLSRAVDAAAVAAAGQMRRIPDDDRGTVNTADDINGEAAGVAQLGLSARQFIEVYGINPTTVLVETCRVQRYRDTAGTPVDRNGVGLFLGDGSVNAAANTEDVERFRDLCTDDEQKLVRVTAQIAAPTTFLRLLGYGTVTLTVEAISQTAVLDVVLVFDVSEAMVSETQYSDWERAGYGYRYLPPRYNVIRQQAGALAGQPELEECWNWRFIVSLSQADVMDGFEVVNPVTGLPFNCPSTLYEPYKWLPAGVDPATQQEPPLQSCRVRIWPQSAYNRSFIGNQWLIDEYIKNDGADPAPFADEAAMRTYFDNPSFPAIASQFHGFVPSYSYYGCCNDPNGDWNFSDLVCQPFGKARDAAQGFLDRLDFLRGDRIAYVTYDRRATVIDPDGASNPQIPMIETQNNIVVGGNVVRRGAEEVLNQVVGVRAENAFYGDSNGDGNWDCIYTGSFIGDVPECISNLDEFHTRTISSIINQPVRDACPFDMIAMDSQYTGPYGQYRWTGTNLVERSPNYADQDTPLDDITTNLPGGMPAFTNTVAPYPPYRNYTYEFRASCAGGNIGGALGAASNMLYLNGRREGAVWLMVLLSSGAAGASDPMGRLQGRNFPPQTTPRLGDQANPFNIGPTRTDGGSGITAQVYEPVAGDYGAFGLCPYGTQDSPGEILRNLFPPFCSDRFPDTRTFCASANQADPPGTVALDNSVNTNCEEFYDVDDYARDWADFIGLANLNLGGGAAQRVGDQLLPTVFTIGFGLTYDAQINDRGQITGYACGATDYNCQRGLTGDQESFQNQRRLGDYLGEELLRYIADVGDNFRIDSDYWQRFMGGRIANGVTDLANADWGARGQCDVPLDQLGSTPREAFAPLPPRTSCGNYFVAATTNDLNRVFNEIASRMFTRLSQ